MTYNVFGGTLNLTQLQCLICWNRLDLTRAGPDDLIGVLGNCWSYDVEQPMNRTRLNTNTKISCSHHELTAGCHIEPYR